MTFFFDFFFPSGVGRTPEPKESRLTIRDDVASAIAATRGERRGLSDGLAYEWLAAGLGLAGLVRGCDARLRRGERRRGLSVGLASSAWLAAGLAAAFSRSCSFFLIFHFLRL